MTEEERDSQRSLARASRLMALGTVFSRLTGFGRVAALAAAFGFTRLTDAYNLANTTPNIVYELVLGGVLGGTLVTVFSRHLAGDPDGGRRAISAITSVVLVGLLGLSALLALLAPSVIGLYGRGARFPADQQAVAVDLLRWFSPQILILGVIAITGALLQARRRFGAPMWAPVAANLLMIAAVLAVPVLYGSGVGLAEARSNSALIAILGAGTTLAFGAQALILVARLRGTAVWGGWVWEPRHPAVRTVIRLSGWLIGLTVANQIALWVVLTYAGRTAGGVSAFQAAQLFFQVPHAVITVSVASAVLPVLSELWAAGRKEEFARRTSWALRSTGLLVVPAALLLFFLAEPIVSIALQRGALTGVGVDLTADILRWLALGIPGFSLFLLLIRCCFAMVDTRMAFWLYVLQNGLAIVVVLAAYPTMGPRALGLAYALSYSAAAVAALIFVSRKTGGIPWRGGR